MVVAPPSYEDPRDASDRPEAMSMDRILRNYVCKLGRNQHGNVHDWIILQRKKCMKEAVI